MPYRVCVLGLGYIGLPTAAFFANTGAEVVGVDIKKETVDAVNAGKVPFVEPGFEDLLKEVVSAGHFKACASPHESEYYIIAVPTPFYEDHSIDTSYIYGAADSISSLLKRGDLIVLESTSSPGTTERLEQYVQAIRPDLFDDEGQYEVGFVHAPERVIPGEIMVEMSSNDRIIGGTTTWASRRASELYRLFCKGEVVETDATTAELAKLAENSFRDVNIAFANELSIICDDLGVNVWELIRLANHHPRVNILSPGPGVGGHCIAVDPWFIVSSVGEKAKLIETARNVNDSKPRFVVDKVLEALSEAGDSRIAVLGLTFKANVDDFRESPAVEVVEMLSESEAVDRIDVVEPNVVELPSSLRKKESVELVSLFEALEANKILVLLVEHDEFYAIPREYIETRSVLDFKGVWEKA